MKIQKMLDSYEESSSRVSDLTRQLAFAGIAVIWVLRIGESSGGIPFTSQVLFPLYLLVIGLGLDFAQYLYKTILWGSLNWYYWKQHQSNDADVVVSGSWNVPTHILFLSNILVVSCGMVLLLIVISEAL